MVAARHMIGDEVHEEAQPRSVRTLHERLQLCHASSGLLHEVGIDIVVVLDGIGRARDSLDRIGVIWTDTMGAVVGLGGVLQQADIPYMASP